MSDYVPLFSFGDMMGLIITIWGNVFLLVMIFSLYVSKKNDDYSKSARNISIPYTEDILRFFIMIFFYNLFYIFIILTDYSESEKGPQYYLTSVFLYYIVAAVLVLFFLFFIKKYIVDQFEDKWIDTLVKVFIGIQLVLLVGLIVNIFTGFIYYYDESLGYQHSWGYYIWQSFNILVFLLICISMFRYFKKIDDFLKYIVVIVVASAIIAVILDMSISYSNFNNTFLIIASILIYMQYENYMAIYAVDLVVEMEDAQRKLMMDQIKPHFLHNSLNSIIYYIDKDPVKAKESLVNFSKYLRTNLDSVNTEDVIPFKEELEHTKVYLSLEKLRFEDKLNIEYDIQDTDFEVPTLSLQPMVENAVKHGIRKSESGSGTVKISTFESETHHIIQVEDDGVGFNTDTLATIDDSHIGVKSVMRRLVIECKGTLEFDSEEGKGTVCTIRIPK